MPLSYKIPLKGDRRTNDQLVCSAYQDLCDRPYAYNPEISCYTEDLEDPAVLDPENLEKFFQFMSDSLIACNLTLGIDTDDVRAVISYIPELEWVIISFPSLDSPNSDSEFLMYDLEFVFQQ